jgi:hypothetical protein
MARCVWALTDETLVEHLTMNEEPNARLWLFEMIDTLPHDQFIRVAITLWSIWTARRKAIHEEIYQSPLSTFGFINSYISELNAIAKP